MGEQSSLVRQWILLRLLSTRPGGLTVKEMAGELATSEKTVRRDLETFEAVGFPLAETVEIYGRKKWRLGNPAGPDDSRASNQPDASFSPRSLPELTFPFDEAAALYLARGLLQPLAGTFLWEAAQRAFAKIRACLKPSALRYLDRFADVFHQRTVGASDYARQAEMIDQLVLACEESRVTFITYQSLGATEPVTYDVYPYDLSWFRNALYLFGGAPRRDGEVRTWKVNRISEVRVEKLQFERPADFDLDKYLSGSFGIWHGAHDVHVTIRFAPQVARFVEEQRWHPSEKQTRQKDGSLLTEFDLSSTTELKTWLLSFGRHAEVLEPQELRQEMREEAELLLTKYAGQEPHRSTGVPPAAQFPTATNEPPDSLAPPRPDESPRSAER